MQSAGRVLLLRCRGAVDGSAPSPLTVSQEAKSKNAKYVVVDTTDAHYADSAGLRWLIALQDAVGDTGRDLRVVASDGARIRRTLAMLGPLTQRLCLFDNLPDAWKPGGPRRNEKLQAKNIRSSRPSIKDAKRAA